MKKQLSIPFSIFLLCIFFSFSGCAREEITPQDPHSNLSLQGQMVTTGRSSTQTCCTVGTGAKMWCAWQPSIQSVLNCCHVESVSPPCYLAPNSPIQTAELYIGVQNIFICTGVYVDDQIDSIVAWADSNRPGFNYVITGWDVVNFGTYNDVCTLKIIVTYQRRFCSFN